MAVPSISRLKSFLIMLPALVLVICTPHDAFSFVDDENASLVLGQPNFTSNLIPARDPNCILVPPVNCHPDEQVLPNVLYRPSYIAFDNRGDLWVSDNGNNRILEFVPPFHDGKNASLVLGQPDLKSERNWPYTAGPVIPPYGISYKTAGHAIVIDTSFHGQEVLAQFTSDPNSGNESVTSNTYMAAPNALNSPNGIAFDSQGNMWVADGMNNRIVEFQPPFSSYMNASLVIGQTDFAGSRPDVSQNRFFNPYDVAFDSGGNMWVADCYGTRVLEFVPPFYSGMSASLVIGQKDFTSAMPSSSASGMLQPQALAFDGSGNLWVSDSANSRVLEFNLPFSDGMAASVAIGQPTLSSNVRDVGPDRITLPTSLAFDSSGNLWIFDENSRVLEFRPPFTTGMNASLVIGQKDFTSKNFALSRNGLDRGPDFVAFDKEGNLWVSENDNNRILEFSSNASAVPEFTFAVPILIVSITLLIVMTWEKH